MKKIIIALIILAFGAFLFSGLLFGEGEKNLQNITTTYGTNCTLDMNEGMIADQTGVEGQTQKLAYGDGFNGIGYFLSMPKSEATKLLTLIQSGEKRMYKDMTYYHFEEKELANTWSAYGTHLKLKTTNQMDIGFIESPITDEVIIIIGGSEAMYNCFQSIKWGNSTTTEEPTETDSLTDTTTTTTNTPNTNTPTENNDDEKTYDSIEEAYAAGDWVPPCGDESDRDDYDYEEGYDYEEEDHNIETTVDDSY